MQTKKCKECGRIKSINNFYGIQGECKECTKKRVKISSRNIKRKCMMCGRLFGTCICEINRGGGKLCSRECWYKWNKEKNVYNWKGDKAGYSALHKWIKSKLGNPNYCEHCKTTKSKKFHWSNKSSKYLRIVSDWQRLCVKCHIKYDLERRKSFIVKCIICNRKINTKSKKRKFCSSNCSNKYYKKII